MLPELRRLLADPPGRPAAVTLPALAAGFRRLLADYLAARVAAGELRPTTPAPRPSCCCQPWPSARSPAPARHRIGVIAFSDYSRAGDLGRGIAWYTALGIGAALLTVLAALVGLTDRPGTPSETALWLALVLTVAHSFTTVRAAPLNFSQRAAAGDPARLAAIFDRFQRWSTARATLQVLTLLSVTWALIASIAGT